MPREQVELIDLIAERVQSLGGIAVGDPRHAAELTTIERPPNGAEDVPVMIDRLLDAHEMVIKKVRAAIEATEEAKDWGTNDLLMGDVLRRHELQVWFVAEHVVDLPLDRLGPLGNASSAKESHMARNGTTTSQLEPRQRRRRWRAAYPLDQGRAVADQIPGAVDEARSALNSAQESIERPARWISRPRRDRRRRVQRRRDRWTVPGRGASDRSSPCRSCRSR